VVSLKRDGAKGVLRVAATSKEGNKKLVLTLGKATVFGADGTKYAGEVGPVDGNLIVPLPEGVRVVVAMNLIGQEFPAKLKTATAIQLNNLTGPNSQPVVLKGKFAVEAP
jgi:hypothetical protein